MKKTLDKIMFIFKYINPPQIGILFLYFLLGIQIFAQLLTAILQEYLVSRMQIYSYGDYMHYIDISIWLVVSVTLILYSGRCFESILTKKIELQLVGNLFSEILKKDIYAIAKFQTADLANRILVNSKSFISVLYICLFQLANNLLLLISAFLYLSRIEFFLAMLIIVSGIATLIIGRFFDGRIKHLTMQTDSIISLLSARINEYIYNFETIKAFKREDFFYKEVSDILWEKKTILDRRSLLKAILWNSLLALNDAVMLVVSLLLCILAIKEQVYIASLFAFINLIGVVQWPFAEISNLLTELKQNVATASRLIDVILIEEDSPKYIVPPKECAINLVDVSFAYNSRTILDGITLEIPVGSRVAIAGESGAGKSTLGKICANLLTPSSGKIETRKVLYISQSPHIFLCSLKENIALGSINTSKEAIERVCMDMGIDELIATLEASDNMITKENGTNYSGGQRQKISIARALVCDADVYIFDEITSALDAETEMDILHRIDCLLHDKTIIHITHKPQILDIVDLVFFVDGGHLASRGTHRELMEHCPMYKSVFEKTRKD